MKAELRCWGFQTCNLNPQPSKTCYKIPKHVPCYPQQRNQCKGLGSFSLPSPTRSELIWVLVGGMLFNYHNKETILFAKDADDANLT